MCKFFDTKVQPVESVGVKSYRYGFENGSVWNTIFIKYRIYTTEGRDYCETE